MREGRERSHVEEDLWFLTDVIGPRLTGSAALRRASEWTAEKFREYGADSTWLEAWRFAPTWQRGTMTLWLIAPHRRPLVGFSMGWAPGTPGEMTGEVVYVDAKTTAEFEERFGGRLAGDWVMTTPYIPLPNPDAGPITRRDSVVLDSLRRIMYAPPENPAERGFRDSLALYLVEEGIGGRITSGAKEFGLLTMSGSPLGIQPYPWIVIPAGMFSQFHRLLARGMEVRIEVDVNNRISADSVLAYNTVAEIHGSERPAEVVLLGAHLDSWDLATGATDNAAGSIAVLEAARILAASDVRPKRTIRFVLFTGEEQGLFGSRLYAEQHAPELGRFQAVLVLDNGTGRITGMSLQGRDDLRLLWEQIFAPISRIGPFEFLSRRKGGTDHLPFIRYGVPSFNFDQLSRGYDHTHHSQVDNFDHAVVGDITQAATVMAATAYQLANLPILLPRN